MGTAPTSVSGDGVHQVEITLTEHGRANLNSDFPNGIYIEGFVTLRDQQSAAPALVYPFLGFCGDWETLHLTSPMVYEETAQTIRPTALAKHLIWSNHKTMRTLDRKSPTQLLAMHIA